MKKFLGIFLASCMMTILISCGKNRQPPEIKDQAQKQISPIETKTSSSYADFYETNPTTDGKIVVITGHRLGHIEEFNSAKQMVNKYGDDRIVHIELPWEAEPPEAVTNYLRRTVEKSEIKALIICANGWEYEIKDVINDLITTKKDMFIVCCNPNKYTYDLYKKANLVLAPDDLSIGRAMTEQAKKLGAKTFVHYSFPRHMVLPIVAKSHELMEQRCAELGIEFVNVEIPDPITEDMPWHLLGLADTQQFIVDAVPKIVEKYGKDTAFYSTSCYTQSTLIKAVTEAGAIYPQPCCPSPYHGFAEAFDIEPYHYEGNEIILSPTDYVISETKRIIAEEGNAERMSTWPVSADMLRIAAAIEYAVKWLDNEVPKDKIDIATLRQIMIDYAEVEVHLNRYAEEIEYVAELYGIPYASDFGYDSFILISMDYITY